MVTGRSIAHIRREYSDKPLQERNIRKDPFLQFERWLAEAIAADIYEPNAMILSTVNQSGRPSSRAVLLKGFDSRGFVFFTNYESRKGVEIKGNRSVALLFYWPELHRQVRIEGRVRKVAKADSENYFRSRPVGAQIGAWASRQSSVISSRKELDLKAAEFSRLWPFGPPKCPPYWGGYRVVPDAMEFWQGRRNRLHDRIVFKKQRGAVWTMTRLAP